MTDIEYLTLEDLISLVRRLHAGPVRDVGLLDAAVARPRSSAFGVDAYASVERNAASLLHSLVRCHALADGDKRLGWLATVVLVDLNRHRVKLDDNAAFDLVMGVAEGHLGVVEIADRLAGVEIASEMVARSLPPRAVLPVYMAR